MASGCSESNNPSSNCLQKISSNCIVWQGDVNTDLNICKGDTITEVINTLLTQILASLEGTNITVNIDGVCNKVNDELAGKTKTLPTILQALVNVICDLSSEITAIQSTSNTTGSFSLVCLTGQSSLQPLENTISIIIEKLCNVKTQVDQLVSQLNNQGDITETVNITVGNYLINAISSCGNNGIVKSGSGANATLLFTGMVPYYAPMPYFGPISWFDNTGKGLSQYGMCGWYIMNGLNGTQNWMGYTFAGATVIPGINSSALDSRVALPNEQSSINDKKGEVKHTLVQNELPAHTHTIIDPGHKHSITGKVVQKSGSGTHIIAVDNYADVNPSPGTVTYSDKIEQASTGVTVDTTGKDLAHENRQPTVYGVWIVRLP